MDTFCYRVERLHITPAEEAALKANISSLERIVRYLGSLAIQHDTHCTGKYSHSVAP